VRYPRGSGTGATLEPLASLPIGKGVVKRQARK
jgi:1-deoxy-D-xylulose-5-phosphate synthase